MLILSPSTTGLPKILVEPHPMVGTSLGVGRYPLSRNPSKFLIRFLPFSLVLMCVSYIYLYRFIYRIVTQVADRSIDEGKAIIPMGFGESITLVYVTKHMEF
jgi:hypothetical protein